MSSIEILKISEEEANCLDELKCYISKNADWDAWKPFLGDRDLLHFVRGRKCNVKSAIKSFENYIEGRRVRYPTLFKTMRPSTNACIKSGALRVLKNRDSLGRAIVVIRPSKWDPSEVTPDDFIRGAVMTGEEIGNIEMVEREGFVIISDSVGLCWAHIHMWKNPFQIRKAVDITFNNAALRYNGIHLVNTTFLLTIFLKLVYPLLPWKFKKRIRYYGRNANGMDKFHEVIPADILPESLGGTLSEEEAWDTELEQRIYAKEDYYERISELI